MENPEEKDRVTVRIEEGVAKAPVAPAITPAETQVVFIPPDASQLAGAYYRGWHDGASLSRYVVFFLAFSIAMLTWMLSKPDATE